MKDLNINKSICCDDIIRGLYNLNSMDLKIYKMLKETEEIKVDELANKLNHERSTIYRSLQKLTTCKLCKKETKTIARGGYYHIYKYENSTKIKARLDDCIEKWYKKMKKTMQNFK